MVSNTTPTPISMPLKKRAVRPDVSSSAITRPPVEEREESCESVAPGAAGSGGDGHAAEQPPASSHDKRTRSPPVMEKESQGESISRISENYINQDKNVSIGAPANREMDGSVVIKEEPAVSPPIYKDELATSFNSSVSLNEPSVENISSTSRLGLPTNQHIRDDRRVVATGPLFPFLPLVPPPPPQPVADWPGNVTNQPPLPFPQPIINLDMYNYLLQVKLLNSISAFTGPMAPQFADGASPLIPPGTGRHGLVLSQPSPPDYIPTDPPSSLPPSHPHIILQHNLAGKRAPVGPHGGATNPATPHGGATNPAVIQQKILQQLQEQQKQAAAPPVLQSNPWNHHHYTASIGKEEEEDCDVDGDLRRQEDDIVERGVVEGPSVAASPNKATFQAKSHNFKPYIPIPIEREGGAVTQLGATVFDHHDDRNLVNSGSTRPKLMAVRRKGIRDTNKYPKDWKGLDKNCDQDDDLPSSLNEPPTGRLKDEKLARELGIPYDVIVNAPDYSRYCSEKNLNKEQIEDVKGIRCRGKNRVAALNYRKRQFDKIKNLTQEFDHKKTTTKKLEKDIEAKNQALNHWRAALYESCKANPECFECFTCQNYRFPQCLNKEHEVWTKKDSNN